MVQAQLFLVRELPIEAVCFCVIWNKPTTYWGKASYPIHKVR